jgi:hypothetical protein
MKTKILTLFSCLVVLLSLSLPLNAHASGLSLTMAIDKPMYRLLRGTPSIINVWGNLTLDGTSVSDGLVSVSAWQLTGYPTNPQFLRPVLFRTLTTGQRPQQNWNVNVSLDVLGFNGNEYVNQTVFHRPSSQQDLGPAFNITWTNTGSEWLQTIYVTLSIFDAAKVPIKTIEVAKIIQPMPPNATAGKIVAPIPLDNWVALGNATAYVCAFDEIPPSNYYAYCPEVSKQFEIVPANASQLSSQANSLVPKTQISSSLDRNYNLTFALDYNTALPLYSPWGNYTIKVTSKYQGLKATNAYVFWARIPGDVGGDGKVDIKDATLVGIHWHHRLPPTYPNPHPNDPVKLAQCRSADINGDCIVDIKDASMVGAYWGSREHGK